MSESQHEPRPYPVYFDPYITTLESSYQPRYVTTQHKVRELLADLAMLEYSSEMLDAEN